MFIYVAQQKLEQEIKERDEKYSDLDSKFSRLHKRAKQRIQDIQKVFVVFLCLFNCILSYLLSILFTKPKTIH